MSSNRKKTIQAIESLSSEIFYAKVRKDMGIENATHENKIKGIENATHENKIKGIENATHEDKIKGIENATHENKIKGIENATHNYCLDALKSLKRQNKGLTALGMLFLIKSLLPGNGGRIKIDNLVVMTGMAKSNILAQFEALETSGIIETVSRDKSGRLIQFADFA